jgi:hypothetical protein
MFTGKTNSSIVWWNFTFISFFFFVLVTVGSIFYTDSDDFFLAVIDFYSLIGTSDNLVLFFCLGKKTSLWVLNKVKNECFCDNFCLYQLFTCIREFLTLLEKKNKKRRKKR